MERRRTSARRARLAAVALLVLAGATACGSDTLVGRPSGTAATVDGTTITVDEVRDLMEVNERFYRQQRQDAPDGADTAELDGLLADIRGESSDPDASFGVAGFDQALSDLILRRIVVDELDRTGGTVTDEDLATVRSQLVQQVGDEAALDEIDPDFLDVTIRSQARVIALQRVLDAAAPEPEAPTEDDIRARWEELRKESPICLQGILAADEAGAAAARARVDAGEDFAAVAAETSTDPTGQDGGALGCATADQAAQSFPIDVTDAQVGDLFGPSPVSGGFVVLRVSSTTGATLEDARPGIVQELSVAATSEVTAEERIAELVRDADVSVNGRYGSWDPADGRVVPPVDPGAARLTPVEGTAPTDPATGP